MERMSSLFGIILASVLLFACVPKAVPVEKSQGPEPVTRETAVAGKEPWEMEWDRVLKEGQKEGTVVVIGGTTVLGLKEGITLFQEKFGIELQPTYFRGAEASTKLMAERRAGLYLRDIWITGQSAMIDFKREGVFDPLPPAFIFPEIVDQKQWYDQTFDWADVDGRYLFNFNLFPGHMVYINTDMVRPGEIRSYYDLLEPKWQGQIVINDPTITGMGSSGFISLFHNKIVEPYFWDRLVAQKPVVTRDQDLQATSVAKGKYAIGLWLSPGAVLRFIEAGAPIRPIEDVKEGTPAGSIGNSLALLNRAPHPNAARVFINWFLSREGQTFNQKVTTKQTRRLDVAPDERDPFGMRKPGAKYILKPDEKEEFLASKDHDVAMEFARRLFAPLIK